MKRVVDRNICARFSINPVHVFVKFRPVSVSVRIVVGDEEIGVDHFVQQGFHQVFTRSQSQERNAESVKENR